MLPGGLVGWVLVLAAGARMYGVGTCVEYVCLSLPRAFAADTGVIYVHMMPHLQFNRIARWQMIFSARYIDVFNSPQSSKTD